MTNRAIIDIVRGITKQPSYSNDPGIYHNPSLGLITILDGEGNAVTIADKNLGATQVYNHGDVLTNATCGNLYQWGNCYGFPGPETDVSEITTAPTASRVNITGYGPSKPNGYYTSSTFVLQTGGTYNWFTGSGGMDLWGDRTDTNDARRGPCSEGYHIPSLADCNLLYNILTGFGISSEDIAVYLKMTNGYRKHNNAEYVYGGYGIYTSNFCGSSDYYSQYCHAFTNEEGISWVFSNASAVPIRPFKNEVVSPDNTWIKLFPRDPGIYHNPSSGLISLSSDGENWITISDKNLGADTVYNDGDTLSESNCGKYFQRGNNYGFDWSGSITKSSAQVDATGYGPGNYYSDSTFIYGNDDWSSVQNDNLWGDTTDTLEARQGPCPTGFHVPTKTDIRNLETAVSSLGITIDGTSVKTYLKMPYTGYRFKTSGNTTYQNIYGYYWTSTPYDTTYGEYGVVGPSGLTYGSWYRAYGLCIRPFKNEPVTPDSTWTKLC